MVGTCAKRRLSASRSNKQNPENFSFKNEHQNARWLEMFPHFRAYF